MTLTQTGPAFLKKVLGQARHFGHASVAQPVPQQIYSVGNCVSLNTFAAEVHSYERDDLVNGKRMQDALITSDARPWQAPRLHSLK